MSSRPSTGGDLSSLNTFPMKVKKSSRNQQELFKFMQEKNVPSIIVKPLKFKSPPRIQQSTGLFVLMFATKQEMNCIYPVIVKTDVKFKPSVYMKCRIDNNVYAGKIISTSENLTALEDYVPHICEKLATGWKAKIIQKDEVIISCTKSLTLTSLLDGDKRIRFLKTILDEIQDGSVNVNKDNGPEFEDVCNEDASTKLNWKSSANMYNDDNNTDKLNFYQEGKHSDSGKLREEKRQQLDDANVDIIVLKSKLEEHLPTLPRDNPFTPVMKNIFKYCKAMNVKLNNMDQKSIKDELIPFTKGFKVTKIKRKDEISIDGLFNCSAESYLYSISADAPRLVSQG